MKIRSEQIEQMTQARRQETQRSMMQELRETAPSATSHYADAALLAVIEQATLKARTYGITSSEATTAFVKLAVVAGANFDEEPKVRQFLQTPELSPDFKMTLLADLVAEQVKKMP